MPNKTKPYSRRDFLRNAGLAGIGSFMAATGRIAEAGQGKTLLTADKGSVTVPTRPFGKTGEHVSMLSLGGIVDLMSNQLLLILFLVVLTESDAVKLTLTKN